MPLQGEKRENKLRNTGLFQVGALGKCGSLFKTLTVRNSVSSASPYFRSHLGLRSVTEEDLTSLKLDDVACRFA